MMELYQYSTIKYLKRQICDQIEKYAIIYVHNKGVGQSFPTFSIIMSYQDLEHCLLFNCYLIRDKPQPFKNIIFLKVP